MSRPRELRILASLLLLCISACAGAAETPPIDRLQLPPGFTLEVLVGDVPDARQLALSDSGTLFVGTRRAGKVYAVDHALDAQRRGAARTILKDLEMPSGLALRDGDLYVGAVSRILKVAAVEAQLAKLGAGDSALVSTTTITDELPTERHHGWKYLKFNPAGELLVPVGAPCNICMSDDPRFAALLAMDPETGASRVIASGIRNTVGFATHPETKELWFTDNGRDMLGDDVPPEEVNILRKDGGHFGYPFIHGGTIKDPEFGDDAHPDAFVKPALKIQAHSAALGVDFHQGQGLPARYRNALFIAEHGSWNRSSKVGYRVSVALDTGPDESPRYEPFIEGWLNGEENWGRPNDVLVAPDGSLLISDDQAGVVYRVRYQEALAGR